MGFRVAWVTVRGKTPEEVRSELGLVETDAREYVPESELTSVPLPSGWYMVFFNDLTAAELEGETLSKLSRGGDVMLFIVEETSMVSLARGYAGGRVPGRSFTTPAKGWSTLRRLGFCHRPSLLSVTD